MNRLERPLNRITTLTGPVAIARFDDGTILLAGPNDEPVLIRNGGVMTLAESRSNGDLVFSYFIQAERLALAARS